MPSSIAAQDLSVTEWPHLQWRSSLKQEWQRELDECERFYRLSARKESGCFPVTGCVSFVTNNSSVANIDEEQLYVEVAFRKAWTTLRHRHPTLASRVEHDKDTDQWKRLYSTLRNENEEKRWLQLTFQTVDVDGDACQWFNEEAPAFEDPTVFFVRQKQGKERLRQTLYLRCPHDITDGVGILHLVEQLFDYASQAYKQGCKYVMPDWGSESVNLSPCLRLAAHIPETLSEAQSKRLEEIQAANSTVYNHSGLLSLPSSSSRTSGPGKRERRQVLISRAITQKILKGCKSIAPGVSVTHVFMSALALVLSELQPRREESYPVRYVNHSMINLRPSCCKPYDSSDHAAAAYHTISAQALGIDLMVAGYSVGEKTAMDEKRLLQIAINVRDFYKSIRPIASAESHEQVVLAPFIFEKLTPPVGMDCHDVSEPFFCPVPLSSIGNISSIVSKVHDPFELERVWAASEPIGAAVAVFLGTWNGEIELAGVFDNRYHDTEYVQMFLGRIVNCVCKGLNIDQSVAPIQSESMESLVNRRQKFEVEETFQ